MTTKSSAGARACAGSVTSPTAGTAPSSKERRDNDVLVMARTFKQPSGKRP
jgi:hypothetical protein